MHELFEVFNQKSLRVVLDSDFNKSPGMVLTERVFTNFKKICFRQFVIFFVCVVKAALYISGEYFEIRDFF